MATQTSHSATSISYAKSLLELANESNQAEAINADLQALREAMDSDPSFAQFFRNPSISDAERLEVLNKAQSGGGSQLLMNFLGVLGAHGRLGTLADVAGAYDDLLGEQLGKTIDNLERTLDVVATLDELVKRLEQRLDRLERQVQRDLRLSRAARDGRLTS